MDLAELFSSMPFAELLGIEVTTVEDGVAEGRLPLTDEHASNPSRSVAHGGVAFALADTVAGAAVVSLIGAPAPTVDMRIDYLKPATEDLTAHAEVVRRGNTSAVVEVTVRQEGNGEGEVYRAAEGDEVARARGLFKLGVEDGAPHDWTFEGGNDSP
jgi:uncharacterized protein (TIGR00369 family)